MMQVFSDGHAANDAFDGGALTASQDSKARRFALVALRNAANYGQVAQVIARDHLPTLVCALKGAARGGTDPGACRSAGFAAEILELVLIAVPEARAILSKLSVVMPLHLLAYEQPLSKSALGILTALTGNEVVPLAVRVAGKEYAALCTELLARAAHESELVGSLCASAAQVTDVRPFVHDVAFNFPDGRALGASRLLLSSASYFRKLLSVQRVGETACSMQTAEAASGVVKLDDTFSFESYEALFKQLHSAGQESLPTDFMQLAELDALAQKMEPLRGKRARDAEETPQPLDPTISIANRCWAAIVKGLTAENVIPFLSAVGARPVLERAKDQADRVIVGFLADAKKETSGFKREWDIFLRVHPEEALAYYKSTHSVRRDVAIRAHWSRYELTRETQT
ncbi:hypothetical protein T492DRAFT_1106471 [Pavlovales sp. CCMP2436]|nr:hypothetical protein T492DRAFT_1106471 [Pavlovales sp. CCMP2436]